MSKPATNRRKWDNQLSIVVQVATVVSILWGIGVWLNSIIVTKYDFNKQRKYIDYQVVKLELDISNRVIDMTENKIEKGEKLTLKEHRDYKQLVNRALELEKLLNELGEDFN